MPFGKYDPGGVIYEAYHDNDVSVIVLLAEDHECKEKARRDLRALYTQDGFTVVHLPIVDFGIPNAQALRVALDATVHEVQSGAKLPSTAPPALEEPDYSPHSWRKSCSICLVRRPSNG